MQKEEIMTKFNALIPSEREALNTAFKEAGNTKPFFRKEGKDNIVLTKEGFAFIKAKFETEEKVLTSETPKAEEVKQENTSEVKNDMVKTPVIEGKAEEVKKPTKTEVRHRVMTTFLTNYLAEKESSHPVALSGQKVVLRSYPETTKASKLTCGIGSRNYDSYETILETAKGLCSILKIDLPKIAPEVEADVRGFFTQLNLVSKEHSDAFKIAHPNAKAPAKAKSTATPEQLEEL